MHRLSRAAITKLQGGRWSAGFWSGFASSGFSVGTKGYGGKLGRTMIMATIGGTVSEISGGKFANGAVTGAFTHLFNTENIAKAFGNPQKSVTFGCTNNGCYGAKINPNYNVNWSKIAANAFQENSWMASMTLAVAGTATTGGGAWVLWAIGAGIDGVSVYQTKDFTQGAGSFATPRTGKPGGIWSIGTTIYNKFKEN